MARYHSEAGGADGDPLMAAITGEPLPQDADAAARAEHRAARADVALLREQLGLVGDALADAGDADVLARLGALDPDVRDELGGEHLPGVPAG
ncbi:hypothetical protein AB0L15_37690, partial [Streptomyces sp. NPDC052693]